MKNRKSVMFVSALLILIFHLWVNVTNFEIERYFKTVSYIGVDMFFFLSAYSMGQRDVSDYVKFIKSRFKGVYLEYIVFAGIAFIYSGWKLERLLKVITGYELIVKGGGAFLWFLPSIMLFYLFVPLLQKADRRNRLLTIMTVLIVWFAGGTVITQFTNYKAMFIFFNRIPVLLLGFYCSRFMNEKNYKLDNIKQFVYGIILVLIGSFCLYKFGYKTKLLFPVYDLFYISAIPSALGLVFLSDLIPSNKLINKLGSITLETYAVQMIFGFNIANKLIKLLKNGSMLNNLIINIITIATVLLIAYIFNSIYVFVQNKIKQKSENNI